MIVSTWRLALRAREHEASGAAADALRSFAYAGAKRLAGRFEKKLKSVNFGKREIRLFLIAVSGLIPTILISNLGTNHYLAAFYRNRASETSG